MEKANWRDVGLPKWPGVIIWGDPVLPEQAEEIILRTMSLHLFSNCKEAMREFYGAMGVRVDLHSGAPDFGDLEKARESSRNLELGYLRNYNVLSAYVFGPHGWVQWDGTVGSRGTNVGKWPGADSIHDEWWLIARAFPYLSLTCQLHDRESCEDNPKTGGTMSDAFRGVTQWQKQQA